MELCIITALILLEVPSEGDVKLSFADSMTMRCDTYLNSRTPHQSWSTSRGGKQSLRATGDPNDRVVTSVK